MKKMEGKKISFGSFVDFFAKTFRNDFLQNFFCSVFELPSLRNTRKRNRTKKVEEKLTSKFWSIFPEKVFDMDFLQKYFCVVFGLPLPRNAKKCTKKKAKKNIFGVGWFLGS
jgi:hypothetical protein